MFYCYIGGLAISAVYEVPVVLGLQQLIFRNLQYLIENNLSSL